jgi:hypothetical protein
VREETAMRVHAPVSVTRHDVIKVSPAAPAATA